jgi:hypothetical protein
VSVVLRVESVFERFVCINEHSNFKAICFQFLSEVLQVYHRLFVRVDLDSCSLIGILCSVLLLECRGVTSIMIVTKSIDFNDGKLYGILVTSNGTFEEHEAIIEAVLERLQKANFRANFKNVILENPKLTI